ncbi:MAG: MBL fold metallo-hydrolase [Actinomycetota bacterium]|nr:MBL fold metallo-hydrolase [Actinomycetota bacterium]
METIVLSTPELGDRSYIVHDGKKALVIDPQRDIERVIEAASNAGVEIVAIAESHMHNDYVTGGYELATLLGVPYLVNEKDEVSFERTGVFDGFEMEIGELTLKVIATPGHTPTHISFEVTDKDGNGTIFSGGSLLYGSVGRPDLLGPELVDFLSRSQFRSVNHLANALPDDFAVAPTHGFGSFCSSNTCEVSNSSTIGAEKTYNFALTIKDEDEFKETLLAGLDEWPTYYAHMGPMNQSGPSSYFDSIPSLLTDDQLAKLIGDGAFVVDLRSGEDFALEHIAGTLALGVGTSFSAYFGWTYSWGDEIALVASDLSQVLEAKRQLARIGIENVVGYSLFANTNPEVLTRSSMQLVTFPGLAEALSTAKSPIVDVRRKNENAQSSIPGAINIPVHNLFERHGELESIKDQTIYVHCAGGYRSVFGASILKKLGFKVVAVRDSYTEEARALVLAKIAA